MQATRNVINAPPHPTPPHPTPMPEKTMKVTGSLIAPSAKIRVRFVYDLFMICPWSVPILWPLAAPCRLRCDTSSPSSAAQLSTESAENRLKRPTQTGTSSMKFRLPGQVSGSFTAMVYKRAAAPCRRPQSDRFGCHMGRRAAQKPRAVNMVCFRYTHRSTYID